MSSSVLKTKLNVVFWPNHASDKMHFPSLPTILRCMVNSVSNLNAFLFQSLFQRNMKATRTLWMDSKINLWVLLLLASVRS